MADIAPTRGSSRGEARCRSFEGRPRPSLLHHTLQPIASPSRSSRISHPASGLPGPNYCMTCVKPPTPSFSSAVLRAGVQNMQLEIGFHKTHARQDPIPAMQASQIQTRSFVAPMMPCPAWLSPIRADNIPPFHHLLAPPSFCDGTGDHESLRIAHFDGSGQ